jgi:hypothetical protein
MQRYDFEVTQGDRTTLHLHAIELRDLSAVWSQIAGLTENSAPKSRIRVKDQSGEILISVGIATARLLQSALRNRVIGKIRGPVSIAH